jgi:hypothetical protein
MIVGVSGKARSGKDTVAGTLARLGNGAVIDISDLGKRFLMLLFDFTEEQLWGDFKEVEDDRYALAGKLLADSIRDCTASFYRGDKDCKVIRSLTPRFVMQHVLENIRVLNKDVWIRNVLKDAEALSCNHVLQYSRVKGLYPARNSSSFDGKRLVVVSGLRSSYDLKEMRRLGHHLVRVKRQIDVSGLDAKHTSETSQDELDDSFFDVVIDNDSTLDSLHKKCHQAFVVLTHK